MYTGALAVVFKLLATWYFAISGTVRVYQSTYSSVIAENTHFKKPCKIAMVGDM